MPNPLQVEKIHIDWVTRALLIVSPLSAMCRFARKLGISPDAAMKAHEAFVDIERIDLIPSATQDRGFQLILNRNTALYFYQHGDHFSYDGFEMGEYESGNVRIFDR